MRSQPRRQAVRALADSTPTKASNLTHRLRATRAAASSTPEHDRLSSPEPLCGCLLTQDAVVRTTEAEW